MTTLINQSIVNRQAAIKAYHEYARTHAEENLSICLRFADAWAGLDSVEDFQERLDYYRDELEVLSTEVIDPTFVTRELNYCLPA